MKTSFSRKKAVFNWSGGKDSALALHKIIQGNEYDVIALLTTLNEENEFSSAHSIPLSLIEKQAESIGIDLYPVFISKTQGDYEAKMKAAVNHFKKLKVTHFIFGDIYLKEVRAYREKNLNPLGIEVVEPLWGNTVQEIMEQYLGSGIQSKIVTTQADKLDATFIGREIEQTVLDSFPENIDQCGENGEYHTFSFKGGPFKNSIHFEITETYKLTFDIGLDNGEVNTFEYWQAKLNE